MLAEVVFPPDWLPGATIILDGAEITEEVYNDVSRGKSRRRHVASLSELHRVSRVRSSLRRRRRIDSLNAGVNQVLHVGHGSSYNMSVGDGSILNYDADNSRTACASSR